MYIEFRTNPLAQLSNEIKISAIEFGRQSVEQQLNMDGRIATSRIKVKHNSISHGQRIDGLPSQETMNEDHIADTIRKATRYLKDTQCTGTSRRDCVAGLHGIALPDGEFKDKCLEVRRTSPYQPYRRLLAADYRDGIYKVRPINNHCDHKKTQ